MFENLYRELIFGWCLSVGTFGAHTEDAVLQDLNFHSIPPKTDLPGSSTDASISPYGNAVFDICLPLS